MTTANTATNTSVDNNEATVAQYSISINNSFKHELNDQQELLKSISEENLTPEQINVITDLFVKNSVVTKHSSKTKRRTKAEAAKDRVEKIKAQIEHSEKMLADAKHYTENAKNKTSVKYINQEARIAYYTPRIVDLKKELEISLECLEEIEKTESQES